ncbi:MAG: hypothetical protein B7Y36_07510 [Novosphingobium sp. 28-62-57]|uniref:multiubiquitin domain-containing protein n=1 Tax=unclassified Novosphingobium TaxID=2644732 RepID=UPI000BD7E376|nr:MULTISPECIES: multiubiquitin domain-containing protein [unclassified Novosphingobium]OYW50989.1 MAG: hypothetical protein B7Z34_01510 [Novosphingobium sp. 12-62-10]OYZ11189.1 MAG: hypothetical protein B7Y36_07510 [Novosphingobium sp. 28-62-57]OZA36246.1 MAG: hypothetical protein B7X92_07095 [Novosphingobium sp. 17-62-9]
MTDLADLTERGALYIEVADTNLNFRPIAISDPTPTGEQILALCDASPRDEYVVLQWLASGDVEEVRADETVAIKGADSARFIVVKADRLFRFVLNDRSISWPKHRIGASTIRTLGKIDPAAQLYLRREEVEDELITDDGHVKLADLGVENIYSKRSVWKLNVQGVQITSEAPMIGVRDALLKAGFDPDQGWIIVLKAADSKRQVSLEDVVDLRAPGVEKLRLTPREINNGEVDEVLRRDFRLLTTDEIGLDARGLEWETIVDSGRRWLLLHNYSLPVGLTARSASIALEIPPSYPTAEIDMFYCLPHLSLENGQMIGQTEARMAIRGQNFQRWSRHRGSVAPWRPNVDNVLTHLTLVDAAILREVEHD